MIGALDGPKRSPFDDPREAEQAMRFGVWLFLIALAALFAATLMGYVVMYVQLSRSGQWPANLPTVPGDLMVSTILLALTSVGLERAARAARRASEAALQREQAEAGGEPEAVLAGRAPMPTTVRRALLASTVLGLLFLGLQARAWIVWLVAVEDLYVDSRGYRFALTGFWVLTGLHALHIIGGALPLGLETWFAFRRPSTDWFRASAIRFTAMYWHFLGAIWLVLYALLLVTTV